MSRPNTVIVKYKKDDVHCLKIWERVSAPWRDEDEWVLVEDTLAEREYSYRQLENEIFAELRYRMES